MSPRKNAHSFSYCTALVLSIAAGIGCVFGSMLLYTAYDEYANSRAWKNIMRIPRETVSVTSSGTPFISVDSGSSLDAERQPLEELPDEPLLQPAKMDDLGARAKPNRGGRYDSDRLRVREFGTRTPSERWFLMLPERDSSRGYFVCYDRETKLVQQYLGPDGFQDELPAERFDLDPSQLYRWSKAGLVDWDDLHRIYGDYNDGRVIFRSDYPLEETQMVFRSEAETYLIDFGRRSIETIAIPSDAVAFGSIGQLTALEQPEADEVFRHDRTHLLKLYLVLQTPEKLICFRPDEESRLEFSLPEVASDRYARYYLTSENELVATVSARDREMIEPGVVEVQTEVLRIAPSGEVLERQTLTHRYAMIVSHLNENLGLNLTLLTAPGTLPSATIAGLMSYVYSQMGQASPEDQKDVHSIVWPALLIATLFSAALCVLVERRQAAYHLPRSYGWLLFVFLLGLPGYIGYRLHRKWPIKEQPKAPVLTGREIFASY